MRHACLNKCDSFTAPGKGVFVKAKRSYIKYSLLTAIDCYY